MKQKPKASGLARPSNPKLFELLSAIHFTPPMKLSERTNPCSISLPHFGQFIRMLRHHKDVDAYTHF